MDVYGSPSAPCSLSDPGFPGNWTYPSAGNNLIDILQSIEVDDIWHAALNGRGGYSSALDPSRLTEAFEYILATVLPIARPLTSNSVDYGARSNDAGVRLLTTTIKTDDRSGEVYAYRTSEGPDDDGPCSGVPRGSLCSEAEWAASEQLSTWDRRAILASADGVLTSFESSDASRQTLTPRQRALLGANAPDRLSADDFGRMRIDYLRGDPNGEESAWFQRPGCAFRDRRASPLRAIVNSQPLVVGPPDGPITEQGCRGSGDSFQAEHADRPSVLYAGASDGMLHAFDAGSRAQVFAYGPELLYPRPASLTEPEYLHRSRRWWKAPWWPRMPVSTVAGIGCWSPALGSARKGLLRCTLPSRRPISPRMDRWTPMSSSVGRTPMPTASIMCPICTRRTRPRCCSRRECMTDWLLQLRAGL